MTPEDILGKRFARATVGGYRADDVNAFIISIADELERLQKEKTDLEGKLIVLADRLESYRSDEESMHSALLNAQKLGDTIVKDSKDKADKLMESALRESEEILSNAKREEKKIERGAKLSLETETQALKKMRREVSAFKVKILAMYQQHMDMIEAIPYNEETQVPDLPAPIQSNMAKEAIGKKNGEKSFSAPSVKLEDDRFQPENRLGFDSEPVKSHVANFKPLEFGEEFRLKHEIEPNINEELSLEE